MYGRSNHESINAVGTYYKPSQWRGKRRIYRSTDPDESKREKVKLIKFAVAIIIGFAVIWALSRWAS